MKNIKNIKSIKTQLSVYSPFILGVYHQDDYPPGNHQNGLDRSHLDGRNLGDDFYKKDGFRMYHGNHVPGFPAHPHRGFETVTIVMDGYVDHSDNMGAKGRYGMGDIQWMTAGSGCQHAEMFPLVHQDRPNPLELFQIWLNLESKHKFTDPNYQMMWHEDVPVFQPSENTKVKIIAGEFGGTQSLKPPKVSYAYEPHHEVGIFLIEIGEHESITLPARSLKNRRQIYFYRGFKVTVENQMVDVMNQVECVAGKEIVIENSFETAYLLVLEGNPLDEPMVAYGPFVMNSQEEIMDAFNDYRKDQFGGWPWSVIDPTHGKSNRFSTDKFGTEVKRG